MVRGPLRALALAIGLAATSCYSVSPTACKTTCDPPGNGPCPAGMTCLSDGFCHESVDEPACEPVDAPPRDAAAPLPDAPAVVDPADATMAP